MTDAPTAADPRLTELVETWQRACADFVALVRQLTPEEAGLPTDLEGWDVQANIAHTAHLEAVLAGGPEETLEVAEAPHLRGLANYYTEQGVLARRDRDLPALAEEIEQAVAARYAELLNDPPTDPEATPSRTPGGIGWSTHTLLRNRPLDVWMHEQDIRRATGRPGGFDSPVAEHVIGAFGTALPMVVGKRLAPPPGTTIRLVVPDAGRAWTVAVGDDGRARPVEGGEDADVTVRLSAEDYVVLSGGRRAVEATSPEISGDEQLGRRLLEVLAVTP
jgi:uncharacterized protein (TIGR03083 family)